MICRPTSLGCPQRKYRFENQAPRNARAIFAAREGRMVWINVGCQNIVMFECVAGRVHEFDSRRIYCELPQLPDNQLISDP